jgi:PPOX class probable F420-dependent enzyme
LCDPWHGHFSEPPTAARRSVTIVEEQMPAMTADECRAFLLERPRTAKLATVRADGRPHIAPIWIALDGEAIIFTTWHTTVKAHNLRRDGRLALCVDDDTPPFSYVIIEGSVIISEDPDDLRIWATWIAARYMGAERADEYGARNGVSGELLVRVTPTRLSGQAGVADQR